MIDVIVIGKPTPTFLKARYALTKYGKLIRGSYYWEGLNIGNILSPARLAASPFIQSAMVKQYGIYIGQINADGYGDYIGKYNADDDWEWMVANKNEIDKIEENEFAYSYKNTYGIYLKSDRNIWKFLKHSRCVDLKFKMMIGSYQSNLGGDNK